MAHTKEQAAEMAEARRELRKFIQVGQTVYCNVRSVSGSGMMRIISLHVIESDHDGKPYLRDITGWVAKALDYRLDRDRWGLKVGGCGMDMCFATVYDLGSALFPDGFGIEATYPNGSKGRPKSREMAARAVKRGVQFRGRNGDASGWDNDGGYALKAVTI